MKINAQAEVNSQDLIVEGPAVIESKHGIRYLYGATLQAIYDIEKGIVMSLVADVGDRVMEYDLDKKVKVDTDNSIVEFSSRLTQYKIREFRDEDKRFMLNVPDSPRAEKS